MTLHRTLSVGLLSVYGWYWQVSECRLLERVRWVWGEETLMTLAVGWWASVVRGEEVGSFHKVAGVCIINTGSPCFVVASVTPSFRVRVRVFFGAILLSKSLSNTLPPSPSCHHESQHRPKLLSILYFGHTMYPRVGHTFMRYYCWCHIRLKVKWKIVVITLVKLADLSSFSVCRYLCIASSAI